LSDLPSSVSNGGTYELALEWGVRGTSKGELCSPTGVAAGGRRQRLCWRFWNHRIQKFTSEGEFVMEWGSEGSDGGHFMDSNEVTIEIKGQDKPACVAEFVFRHYF